MDDDTELSLDADLKKCIRITRLNIKVIYAKNHNKNFEKSWQNPNTTKSKIL